MEGLSVEGTKTPGETDSRETTNGRKNTTDRKEVTEIEIRAETGDANEELEQTVEVEQSAESEVENAVIKRMVIRGVKTVRQILKLIQHSHVDEVVEQEAEKAGNLCFQVYFLFA